MRQWVLLVLIVALSAGLLLVILHSVQEQKSAMDNDPGVVLLNDVISFDQDVKPVLERRCVVCHGCYDAPCQLKLSSHEGLQRGSSKERIYEPKRLTTMQPTRLFIDAKTTQEWRLRGFSPVLNEDQGNSGERNAKRSGEKNGKRGGENESIANKNLDNSVLYHLLRLKQEHPQPNVEKLPKIFTLGLNREDSCPTLDTIDSFAEEHPLWGMPYAMPNLSDSDYQTLVSWVAQGTIVSPSPGPSVEVYPQLNAWERFFNQSSNKSRLLSRYLYEHLFHAHIHFEGSPVREFYRMVRSATPPGKTINEIPTLRPYDDPGKAPFYYRLMRYRPSIVVKNHIVYTFSPGRMQRYRELFLTPDYVVDQLPSYEAKIASNPFKIFRALPAMSRYRFLLDDAHFFIEGFIKGPVCRGQIALDVIEDQFWVLFFDPRQSVITNNAAFIEEMSDELQVPAEGGSNLELIRIWTEYWKGQRRYMEKKQAWFKTIGTHDLKHAMNFIWDGDGVNPNAALTVFRHFDSGSVAYGLVGDKPETAWVIDYPLFERIHYLLVAGFDVYGNMGHRLSTRIYMDFLRMEGEDYFLAFLPADQRKAIRDSWYVGQRRTIDELFSAPQEWLNTEAVSGYKSNDPQRELYTSIDHRLGPILQRAENMNLCGEVDCKKITSKNGISSINHGERSKITENTSFTMVYGEDTQNDINRVDQLMTKIAKLRGKNLHAFPDVAFLQVRMNIPDEDLSYTLIRNKAYKNVTSFLADEHKRDLSDIEKDSMTVVNWLEGSYPNFFFSVALADMEEFSNRCETIRNHDDYEKFVDQYGVRRTNPNFWVTADWFQAESAKKKRVLSGLFDLNRYLNH